jgi:predicted O-methyltransferase YrrM
VGGAVTPRLERVRAVRERLLAAGTIDVRGDGSLARLSPVAIGPVEGLALRSWVQRAGASRTLETGLGYAVSTLFIVDGLLANGPDGRHVAADPYQRSGLPSQRTKYEGVGLRILDDAGVRDLVEFYEEESQIVLPRLLADGRRFEFAFLDGNHRFEGVFLDLIYCGRLLDDGGIIFVDDVQLPGVRRAVDFCLANLGWVREDGGKEDAHEWSVVKVGPRDVFERPFAEFIDF